MNLVLPFCNFHNYLQLAFAGVAPRPKRLGRDVKYRSETQLSGSLEAAALMPWAQVRGWEAATGAGEERQWDVCG